MPRIMAIDVQSFIKNLKKNRSKLDQWQGDIFKLLSLNATYAEIAQFLNLNGVKVVDAEIYLFTHRKKRKALLENALRGRVNASNIDNTLDVQQARQEPEILAIGTRCGSEQVQQEPVAVPIIAKKVSDSKTPISGETKTSIKKSGELPKFNYKEALAKAKLQVPK